MKFRKGNRLEATVEITPLIDVVFLLLIFFMVSTTFIRESQLKINLPEASGELQEIEPGVIEVSIDASGNYALNGVALANNRLPTLLRALSGELAGQASGDENGRLIITADANATHQAVVRAMDAAGQVGLTRISITTQNPDDES